MLFGMVSAVGRGTGVLDGGGDRRKGRGSFGGEFGASHCNQWGTCDALFSNYFEDLLHYVAESSPLLTCPSVLRYSDPFGMPQR